MKMYKNDGEEHILAGKPSKVKLGEALRELDKFPTVETRELIRRILRDSDCRILRKEGKSAHIRAF